MKNYFKVALLSLSVLCSCQSDGWQDLFNGKDLSGFKQLNGKAPYHVEDGCLVGTTKAGEPNSFLSTEQLYGDFILEFEVLCDPSMNSGVQFRSESLPEYNNGRVHGYQCEIDPSDRAWSGGIYDEARRGWLVPLTNNPEGRAAYKKTGWNKYRIEAVGNNMRIWLNGVNTANLYDDMTPKGFIAFQVHGIGNNKEKEGKEIRWRNIRIKTDDLQASLMQGKLAPVVNKIPNTLTEEEKADGWQLLFDGKSMDAAWRSVKADTFPKHGWTIADGALTLLNKKGERHGGDIVTRKEYSAFELAFEFKITEGANGGVKYFVQESKKGNWAWGLEFQVLDDKKHPDANCYTTFPGSRTVASLYDIIPATNKRFNGPGRWNQGVIKVFPNNHIEHWLNGFKVVEYDRKTDAFREKLKGSKYMGKGYQENGPFCEEDQGRILIQDHGDVVSYRSIKIKELK